MVHHRREHVRHGCGVGIGCEKAVDDALRERDTQRRERVSVPALGW